VSQGITVSPATEMGAMGDSSSCFQHSRDRLHHMPWSKTSTTPPPTANFDIVVVTSDIAFD